MTAPKQKRGGRIKKLREWSPKVNDPRQLDLIEYAERKPQRDGFALLDAAIAAALREGDNND